MRVALFTESLPPLVDGVARTLTRLCETMAQDGIGFRIVTPVRPDATFPWRERVHTVASVPVALYDYYRMGLPYLQGVSRMLDRWRPHLIHLANPTPLNLFGSAYARRRGVPVVSSYHTHFVRYFRYYGFGGLEEAGWRYLRWFHNRTARTFAPSPSAVRELAARGVRGAALWGRGIDLERFTPEWRDEALRRAVGAGPDVPLLLFVGRLVKEKDLDDLVAADGILRARGRRYRLGLVGDGPMRAELEERLPQAHFTGTVTGETLHRWFASADAFVFPSTTETFGNVVLESAASGVPAVVADRGGVVDVVRHGVTGLIARANDPLDFAAKVEALLAHPARARRLGVQARALARSASWTEVNRGLIGRWEEVVKAGGRVMQAA
jgi:glycosyltransferase involved in cell wall biosynthesis